MSIRPVETSLPPPLSVGQSGGENPPAPAATPQPGASAVSGVETTSTNTAAQNNARAAAKEHGPLDRDRIKAAAEEAQQAIAPRTSDIAISVDDKTDEVVVRIIDRESKEVIRQIPAEELLRLAERLQALAGENKPGLLLEQRA